MNITYSPDDLELMGELLSADDAYFAEAYGVFLDDGEMEDDYDFPEFPEV